MDSIVNIDKITGTNCLTDIKTSFYYILIFGRKQPVRSVPLTSL